MIFSSWMRRAVLHYDHIDFRKGMDSLVGICSRELGFNTRDGTAFIFTNRSRSGLKVLLYDGQGFWVCHKRLSSGKLRHWPKSSDDSKSLELTTQELLVVLFDGDLSRVRFKQDFCKIA